MRAGSFNVYYKIMPVITICTSASFYRQVIDVQTKLEQMGYEIIVPFTATQMKTSGDFDVSHYKTWFDVAGDYDKKAALMHRHFAEIEKGDMVLILNYEKHGVANYIGGNVLMEMALAFYLNKPIFVLNDTPQDSPFLEEILGMQPIFLHGKLEVLPAEYQKLA
jgi:hypothetical protein